MSAPPQAFADRSVLIHEVKAIRPNHSLTPANVIEATALAVRRYTNSLDFDRVVAKLPEGAREFWRVDAADPRELEQQII